MDKIKQNDWVVINIANPNDNGDLSPINLIDNGINSENTSIRSKEYYKGTAKIQELFKNGVGELDEAKFNEFYDGMLSSYNQFSNIDSSEYLMENYESNFYDPFKEEDSKIKEWNIETVKLNNPFEQSYGLFNRGRGNRTSSIVELAQKNKYWDNSSQEWSDKTPNDLGSLGVLSTDTLVVAQWDESGVSIDKETGDEVNHKKGDYKLDENGKFYYETLAGKEYYGKNSLKMLDVLTTDNSSYNKFDIFDSDGINTSPIKSTLKTMVTIAPYFIPYVGQVWAGVNAAVELTKAMPTIVKTLGGFANDNIGNYKGLNNVENFMQKFGSSSSEYASNHNFSYENIMNMVSDSAGQLFQQQFIAGIPKLLGMEKSASKILDKNVQKMLTKAGENGFLSAGMSKEAVANIVKSLPEYKKAHDIYQKYTKTSKALSLAYMTATSSSHAYADAINLGFDRNSASAISTGVYLGIGTLFSQDYFKKFLWSGLGLDTQEGLNRMMIKQYIKNNSKNLFVNSEKTSSATIMNKVKDYVSKHIDDTLYMDGNVVSGMISESVEEVTEEVLTDGAKALGNVFVALKKSLGSESATGNFDYMKSDPFSRYSMTAFGGALGGGVFKMANRIKNGKSNNQMESVLEDNNLIAKELIKGMVTGDAEEFVKIAEGFRGSKLGSTTLSAFDFNEKGTYSEIAKTSNDTQNNVLIDSFVKWVKDTNQFINQKSLNQSKNDFDNIDLYKGMIANQIIGAKSGESELSTIMFTDYNNIVLKLTLLNSEIKSLQDSEDDNKVEISFKQSEFKQLEQDARDIMTGSNDIYFGRLLFSLNPLLTKGLAFNNIDQYSKDLYKIDYKSASKNAIEYIDGKYKEYVESGFAQHDFYRGYDLLKKKIENKRNAIENQNEIAGNYETNILRTPEGYSTLTLNKETNEIRDDSMDGLYLDGIEDSDHIDLLKNLLKNFKSLKNGTVAHEGIEGSNVIGYYQIATDVLNKKIEGIEKSLEIMPSDVDNYESEKLKLLIGLDHITRFQKFVQKLYTVNQNPESGEWEINYNEAYKFEAYSDINIDSFLNNGVSIKPIDIYLDGILSLKEEFILDTEHKSKLDEIDNELDDLIQDVNATTDYTRNPNQPLGFTAILNDFWKIHKKNEDLPVLKEEVSNSILNKIAELKTKIKYINDTNKTNTNNESYLETQNGVNLKYKMIQVYGSKGFLIGKDVDLFKTINPDKKELIGDDSIDDIVISASNILIDNDNQPVLVQGEQLDSLSLLLDKILLYNENILRNMYNESKNNGTIEVFLDTLWNSFSNHEAEPSFISINEDWDTKSGSKIMYSQDSFNFWYIISSLSEGANQFLDNFNDILNEGSYIKAPFSSQEFISKQIVSFIYQNEDVVEFIGRKLSNTDNKTWYKTTNLFRFSAGAGVGKTAAIIPLAYQVLKKIDKNANVYFVAPTEDNLSNFNTGSPNGSIPDNKKITTTKFILDLGWTDDWDGSESSMGINNNINKAIVFIDEATWLTKSQLQYLDIYSKLNGTKFILIGDLLQSGEGALDLSLSFLGGSLYESKRATTSIGKTNLKELSNAVIKALGTNSISRFELEYHIGDKDFLGIANAKDTNTNMDDILNVIKNDNNASVLFYGEPNITNGVSSIGFDIGIDKIIYNSNKFQDIQGQEYDYVIVNTKDDINANVKDILTLLTRAKKGTIIYNIPSTNVTVATSYVKVDEFIPLQLNKNFIQKELDSRKLETNNLVEFKKTLSIKNDVSILIEDQVVDNTVEEAEIIEETTEAEIIVSEPIVIEVEPEIEEVKHITKITEEVVVPVKESSIINIGKDQITNVYTFANRLNGELQNDDGVTNYIPNINKEDLSIFLRETTSISTIDFQIALENLNVIKNYLIGKLIDGSDPSTFEDVITNNFKFETKGGMFLIKINEYNIKSDRLSNKGNEKTFNGKTIKTLIFRNPNGEEINILMLSGLKQVETNLTKRLSELNNGYYYFSGIKFNKSRRVLYFEKQEDDQNGSWSPLLFEPIGINNTYKYKINNGSYSFTNFTPPITLSKGTISQVNDIIDRINSDYNILSQYVSELMRGESVIKMSKISSTITPITISSRNPGNTGSILKGYIRELNEYSEKLNELTKKGEEEIIDEFKKISLDYQLVSLTIPSYSKSEESSKFYLNIMENNTNGIKENILSLYERVIHASKHNNDNSGIDNIELTNFISDVMLLETSKWTNIDKKASENIFKFYLKLNNNSEFLNNFLSLAYSGMNEWNNSKTLIKSTNTNMYSSRWNLMWNKNMIINNDQSKEFFLLSIDNGDIGLKETKWIDSDNKNRPVLKIKKPDILERGFMTVTTNDNLIVKEESNKEIEILANDIKKEKINEKIVETIKEDTINNTEFDIKIWASQIQNGSKFVNNNGVSFSNNESFNEILDDYVINSDEPTFEDNFEEINEELGLGFDSYTEFVEAQLKTC